MAEMPGPGAGMPGLVAVVVTHNRLAQLRLTLGRLLASPPDVLAAVLVVDNASSDGTGAWLAGQAGPRLHVLALAENRGGAGGFEAGMRAAVDRFDPGWIVVMDDDARPEPGALEAFAAMDRRGWDALAAAVRYPGGGICPMNRPLRNPFRRGARGGGGHLGPDAYAAGAPVQAVDGASFVGLFLSRGAIARAGYPDGALFLYADDGLYTLGLTQGGGRLGFAPALGFEHDCSTLAPGSGRFRPLWKTYYYHRNMVLLYRRMAGPWFWAVLPLVLAKWALKLRHHPGERRAFLRLLRHAVADGIAGRTARPHGQVLALAGTAS